MDAMKPLRSKAFPIALIAVCLLILLLLAFKVGVIVGYQKAQFSYRWGENYQRNFAGPRGGFFLNAHGAFGTILGINGNTMVVAGRDNVERIVLLKENTMLTRFRQRIPLSELKNNDTVMVIGSPNDAGQIEAKLIRVMPAGVWR